MSADQFLNVALILATIMPTLLTLHWRNGQRNRKIDDDIQALLQFTRRHDKITKRLRKQIEELRERISRITNETSA